jgi:hypothetical protein
MSAIARTLAALLAASCPAGSALAQELAAATCDYGARSPDAPAELAQFDFLIGDYTVSAHGWDEEAGQWTPPRSGAPARWNGRWVLGGTAIADEWFDRDPGMVPDASRGINVRMWDSEAGEFDMMWVADSNHQVQDLRARMIDGVLTMWQVYPERPAFRAYFNRFGDGSWERISLVPDGEGGWRKQFRLHATPIPCR